MTIRRFTLLAVLALASCSSTRTLLGGAPERLRAREVPEVLERAEADLAAGRAERALPWLRAAHAATGLDHDLRTRVQSTYERAARMRLDELSGPGSSPSRLDDLLEHDLPRQISVTAAVRAAELYLERDEPMEAFRLVKKLDAKFPAHHERAAAGRVIASAGFTIAESDARFLWFFERKDRAKEVLEYLVLNYPSEQSCDQAYAVLARLYQEDGDYELAVEKLEDLLLYHPQSPWAPAAEAQIPHLRLAAIESPEYDRGELLRSEAELVAWLARYADHELAAEVRLDLVDCRARMFESDMDIATFYRRVDNESGARLHATRALTTADSVGDGERAERAATFLASLPPEDFTSDADRLLERPTETTEREQGIIDVFEERAESP